jgi:hypothetical protein
MLPQRVPYIINAVYHVIASFSHLTCPWPDKWSNILRFTFPVTYNDIKLIFDNMYKSQLSSVAVELSSCMKYQPTHCNESSWCGV